MAKVLGVDKLKNKVRATLNSSIAQSNLLDQVGEFTKDRIYKFTKQGKSLVTGQGLKSLTPAYKAYRKRFQEWNKTGDFFSPSRSNLTLTGQLLDALGFKVSKSKHTVEVFVEDSQRSPTPQTPQKAWVEGRSTNKFKKRIAQEALTNSEVAKEVAKKGRPFIGIDDTGLERIKVMALRAIRKELFRDGFKK